MRYALHFVLTLMLLFVPYHFVDAHPGRTDANGGHTCRTNCTERWGLQYGEYHYHNGGSSSSGGGSSTRQSYSKPRPKPAQKAPTVQKKTIVAVDQASVLAYPHATEATSKLWYGFEIIDLGSYDEGYVQMDQGYVSKLLLTSYTVTKAKSVKVATDKAYFFATPAASTHVRGTAIKDTLVNVVGESNGFYFGSTKDATGKVLVGFVSKTVVK